MNKVIIIGRLVKDPEIRHTNNNLAYSRFIVAVDRAYRTQDGEKQTDFINCIAWRKTAENLVKYMRQGSQIAVEGSIQTGSYEKDGRTFYTTNVLAERIEFLSRVETQQTQQSYQTSNSYQKQENPLEEKQENNPFENMEYDVNNEDLPF